MCQHVFVCVSTCVCVSACVCSVFNVCQSVYSVCRSVYTVQWVETHAGPPLDLGPLIIMISKFYFLTIQNIGIMFSCFKTQIYSFHQKTVYLNIRFLDNGTSNQVCFDSTAQVYCLYKVQVPPTPLQSWNGKSKFLNFWFGKTEYLHFHNIWLMLGNVIFKISWYGTTEYCD